MNATTTTTDASLPVDGDDEASLFLRNVRKEAGDLEYVRIETRWESGMTLPHEWPRDAPIVGEEFRPRREYAEEMAARFVAVRAKLCVWRLDACDAAEARINLRLPRLLDTGEAWVDYCRREPPLTCVLLALEDVHVAWLCEVLCDHVCAAARVTSDELRWIYAVLVLIDLPLLPETTARLRSLARRLATERAFVISARHTQTSIAALNIILCLISRVFGQSDVS